MSESKITEAKTSIKLLREAYADPTRASDVVDRINDISAHLKEVMGTMYGLDEKQASDVLELTADFQTLKGSTVNLELAKDIEVRLGIPHDKVEKYTRFVTVALDRQAKMAAKDLGLL